jgi:PAS domain S-box-containing protein
MAQAAPIPDNEARRLDALRTLIILDSEPEAIFDRLVRLASEVSGAPIALMTLVDAERQWFKASVGLPGLRQTPRDVSFCAHAIAGDEVMEVPDVAHDPRFFDNPLVVGEPGIRFYAGAPLTLPDGSRVGTLCVIDRQPRRLGAAQVVMLKSLAAIATDALLLRRTLIEKSLAVRTSYERGLAESESRYRAIVEDQSELVSLATFGGELVYVNPAYARHFGCTPAEMIGTNLFAYIDASDRAAVRLHLDRVIHEGASLSDENRMAGADGTVRWVAWTNAVQIQQGREPMLHSVGRDVTERRALKAQLARSAADYRDLYDNAPCGYHSLDATGRYVEINATELRWLGCSRAEVIGRLGPEEFLTEEGKATFRHNAARVMADGRAESLQFDLVSRDRRTRRVGISATVQKDSDGKFLRTLSVMYDLTAQHLAEQQNLALLREQAAMVDTEIVGIVKLRAGRIHWHNVGLRKLFGYTSAELDGQSSRMLYPDDATYEGFGHSAYQVLAAGQVYRGEVPMRRQDGQDVWIAAYGVMLDAAARESMWFLADLTAVKQAEQHRVKAATVEAENRALADFARIKGQFLSSMSHELRTPLNCILGFAHLMQSAHIGLDSPRNAQYLSQISASGRQLLSLVEALLDAAQLQAGTLSFTPQPVDLAHLVVDTVESYRPAALAKPMDLGSRVDHVGPAYLDPMRFRQVLGALLSNAIKFGPAHSATLVQVRQEGPDRIRVMVKDQGPGITQADMQRLFLPFSQLSVGTARTHDGAGLGLSLVKQLVESQGGCVGVDSVPGVGSVFHFILPVRRPD